MAYGSLRRSRYSRYSHFWRYSKSGFAATDASAYHGTIFGSTGEHSFDYDAKLAGVVRDDGELAAVRNGRPTVIDRFPESLLPERREAWARSTLKRVRHGCKRHHGVALRPFVEYLMSDPQRVERCVKDYMAEFMERIDTRPMTPAQEHAAENFALIYAGGCLAIDAGILPYLKKDVMRAITRCCRDALKIACEDNDPLLRARRILRWWLESDRIFEMKSPNDRFDEFRFGGYVIKDGQRSKYVIRAASLRRWFETDPAALVVKISSVLKVLQNRLRREAVMAGW